MILIWLVDLSIPRSMADFNVFLFSPDVFSLGQRSYHESVVQTEMTRPHWLPWMSQGWTSHFRIAFLIVHSAKNNKWDCWIVGFPSALTTWIRIMHITPRIYIEYCLDRYINLEEQHKSQCYQLYHRFCLLDSGQVIMITKPATGQHWWLTWGYILQVHDDSWRYWEHNSASW